MVRNWKKDRCNVAWRWNWLCLRVNNLKRELELCEKETENIRKKKHKLEPEFKEEDGDEQSTRTVGFIPPKENIHLLFTKSPGGTVLDRTTHRVLKAKVSKKRNNAHVMEDEYKPSYHRNNKNSNVEITTKKEKKSSTSSFTYSSSFQFSFYWKFKT